MVHLQILVVNAFALRRKLEEMAEYTDCVAGSIWSAFTLTLMYIFRMTRTMIKQVDPPQGITVFIFKADRTQGTNFLVLCIRGSGALRRTYLINERGLVFQIYHLFLECLIMRKASLIIIIWLCMMTSSHKVAAKPSPSPSKPLSVSYYTQKQ